MSSATEHPSIEEDCRWLSLRELAAIREAGPMPEGSLTATSGRSTSFEDYRERLRELLTGRLYGNQHTLSEREEKYIWYLADSFIELRISATSKEVNDVNDRNFEWWDNSGHSKGEPPIRRTGRAMRPAGRPEEPLNASATNQQKRSPGSVEDAGDQSTVTDLA